MSHPMIRFCLEVQLTETQSMHEQTLEALLGLAKALADNPADIEKLSAYNIKPRKVILAFCENSCGTDVTDAIPILCQLASVITEDVENA